MRWIKRLLIAAPFVIAAVLNVLSATANRLHLPGERIAGYGFLFAAPWAWLIDLVGGLPDWHNRWLSLLIGYLFILWIPAALYSGCLWLFLLGLARIRASRTR